MGTRKVCGRADRHLPARVRGHERHRGVRRRLRNGIPTTGYVGIAFAFGLTLTVLAYEGVSLHGLAIGAALLVIHLAKICFSSGSVNPARAIGLAAFVGGTALSQLWVFIVAPIVGGLIAAGVHVAFRLPEGARADTEAF
jgi:aquaporin Z